MPNFRIRYPVRIELSNNVPPPIVASLTASLILKSQRITLLKSVKVFFFRYIEVDIQATTHLAMNSNFLK